ncbi:MAG: DUF3853 family protein [Rikenellaceae bacterium]
MNKNEIQVSDFTPIAMLTVGQLRKVLQFKEVTQVDIQPSKRYVYGLRGIRELADCSHGTAQKLKDTILQPAVTQVGRKIIVDVDMAMDLLKRGGRLWR